MQILFVTDIHSRTAGLEALPPADLVLVGGDVTQFGSPADVQRGLAALAEGKPSEAKELFGRALKERPSLIWAKAMAERP